MKGTIMKKLSLILMPIVCLLWIGFIFSMSSDVNSNTRTIEISEQIQSEVGISDTRVSVDVINVALRKVSHFFEYFLLAILLSFTARVYSYKYKSCIIYILFIALLVANLDELYQSFVGRTSMVADCLIDLSGGIFGIVVYGIIASLFSKYRGSSIQDSKHVTALADHEK
jgi:VanZ family protein